MKLVKNFKRDIQLVSDSGEEIREIVSGYLDFFKEEKITHIDPELIADGCAFLNFKKPKALMLDDGEIVTIRHKSGDSYEVLNREYFDSVKQEPPESPDDAFKSSQDPSDNAELFKIIPTNYTGRKWFLKNQDDLNKINLSEGCLYKDESGYFTIRNGEKNYPSNFNSNKGENKMRESIANVYENTKDAVLVDKWFGDCRSFTDGCLKNESFLTELFFKANKEEILAKAKEWEKEWEGERV